MDEFTTRDIDERVEKILKEIGILEPPVDLEDVLDFLDLHRGYYDLTNPNLVQEVTHRLKIGAFKIKEILGKVDLRGLWYPDEKKILIDESIPEIKKRWVSSHEIGHRIVPWHKDFIFGDTAETLDPEYHETLEAEANYAASSMLFLSGRFTEEARDFSQCINSVKKLSKIYGNSTTMTLRRFTQYSSDLPSAAVISKPHWKDEHIFDSNEDLCRYFIPSSRFGSEFPSITSTLLIDQIKSFTRERRGGPVGEGEIVLLDANGQAHSFVGESFFNRYDILTLIVYKGKVPVMG